MHTGLFAAFIVLIISALIFLTFAVIGIILIVRGRKRRIKTTRVHGIFMIILGLIIGSVVFWPGFSYFYIELQWFKGLGYESLFWKLNNLPWFLFLRFGLMALAFMVANFFLAWRLCPIPGSFQRWGAKRANTLHRLLIAVILVISVVMGSVAIPMWDEYRRYEEREPYLLKDQHTGKEEAAVDPQFGEDLSYYLFKMPIRNFTSIWAKALFYVTIMLVGIQYDFYRRRDSQTKIYVMKRGVFHLSLLWLLLLAVSIWRSDVNLHNFVYSENGFAFGPGYTDVHIRIPAYHIYMVIVAVVALTVIINSFWKKKYLVTIPVGLWIGSYLILIWVIPSIFQYIKVSPNEPILEHDYISRNIYYTRLGYDLERIKTSEIVPEVATLEKIKQHPGTLKNVQLWDRRATRDFLNQNQVFRPYYKFFDVDADRYYITDPVTGQREYRQVMITAREMDSSKLDPKSRTWVTQKLTYTHGYGVCLGPVNQFTAKGEPYLWIRGIPPSLSYPELKINRPEIYYGEVTRNYIFVHTSQKEFNYPAQEGEQKKDEETTYEGTGGVLISSFLRRCMIATRFHDFRVITSEYLKPESRVMFNRQIMDRVKRIAPFLLYDEDPYVVIGDSGRLWWVIDVYTASKGFPCSEPYHDKFNYIRNPFKAVVDAYNGTVDFYVWDDSEVITKVYRKSFPELFKSRDQMPDGLGKHNRYPTDLTQIQSEMYCLYHMEDPQAFFSRSDRWDIPHEVYYQPRAVKTESQQDQTGGTEDKQIVKPAERISIPMTPLYVMISVPTEQRKDPEFVSIISFTPWPTQDRPNMVAWMVVRNDMPHYGEILVYDFPKGQPFPGPAQIESRIDVNPEMSEKFTLWNEGGSAVIRGNLLVLPVDNSIFYVEPVYLQAQIATMPMLTQVIVAAGDKVAWAENFDMAMEKVFGVGEEVIPEAIEPEIQDPLTSIVSMLDEKIAKFKEQVQNNDSKMSLTLDEIKKLMVQLEKYKR
jgi:hypothetical protein